MSIKGFDISNWQGVHTVAQFQQALAGGFEFVCIKASEGTAFRDPDFQQNMANAKEAGYRVRIAYHFAKPGQSTAAAEAAFFSQCVGGALGPGDNTAIDSEDTSTGECGQHVHDLLHALPELMGTPNPLGYTGDWYIPGHMDFAPLSTHLLWDANYHVGMVVPMGTGPWAGQRVTIWQNADNGYVPGFGTIDVDLFDGTIEQLIALGKGGVPTTEDDMLTAAQLLNIKRGYVWMERLHHEGWPSDPNAQENDIDVFARQIDDNLNFEPVITAIHSIFEKNGQPSTEEMLAAIRSAKLGVHEPKRVAGRGQEHHGEHRR